MTARVRPRRSSSVVRRAWPLQLSVSRRAATALIRMRSTWSGSLSSAIPQPPRMSLRIKLADPSVLTKAILVIALIGTLEAGYLTYVHYHLGLLACIGGHHGVSTCEKVQSSVYSKLAGIPVAWLGLFGYLGIL